eukprot:XP_006243583.1 PREDICTED: uncharacterized protein LOC100910033 [Rattus norvegicus]
MPHCPAAEAGAPRGDSRTRAPPPGGPEFRHPPCSSPPPQPHCLPRLAPPRGTRAPAASRAPRARGGGGSLGRAVSQRRAPSEPRLAGRGERRGPRARVLRRRLRRHVSAGERKSDSAGTGDGPRELAREGVSQRASEEKGGHSCLSGRGREWESWGRRCREGRTKTERTGRPTAGRGGKGRRRSCRRAGAEGVSERSGRAREGREGGSRGGARAHWERARRRVELDRVCCQRRELRPPFYNSSTRAGHREQRARVPRHPTRSDRIPRPQPRGEISGNMATEHVNGNGTEEPMDTTSAVIHSENFQTLLDAGLPQKVAEKLDEIYVAGLVAHSDLDERAIEALKEFNEDGALAVLQQFKDSDLSHVQNKSAFLCGVMKTYRQREKQGTKVADSSKGPDEAKIKALLERTGYTLDVTTGQRKYGGPPPDSVYSGQQPSVGTEIFVGKIPRDLFEDELVPLFEKAGPIWDLRLMMDPLTGLNRGYAFVTFCTKEAAQEAVKLVSFLFFSSPFSLGLMSVFA